MSEIRTTCPYCGVGCGVIAEVNDNKIVAVRGDPDHPANHGSLCIKGTELAGEIDVGQRFTTPMVDGVQVDWSTAISTVASRLQLTRRTHGASSIAMYLSGQLLTEDYYVANKLMKGFLGSSNVDTNSRLCMSSAVAAHKRAFGEDVVPCDYEDLDRAELIILVGSNAAWTHPVVYQRIERAQAKGTQLIVIDPRRTPTCEAADLHLAINPGADALLFNQLLAWLEQQGHLDEAFVTNHTSGYAEARQPLLDLDETARLCGITRDHLAIFFTSFAGTDAVVTLFSQGANQSSHGSDNGNAIINCHLATGRIGKPGAGPFSITGQPNAMGGREVGGMANQLAAHLDFGADQLAVVGDFWGAPDIAREPGLLAVDMFDAVDRGEIQAIWIMGTNPAVSLPDSEKINRALANCPLVIVSEAIHPTDTSRHANILLPAMPWSEKDGTVTNSSRVVSRQRRLITRSGAQRPDWQILCGVACEMGFGDAFSYTSPADIFREHAALTGIAATQGRLLDLGDYRDIDDDTFAELEPFTWPAHRPFADGRFSTPSGKAMFVPIAAHLPDTVPDGAARFILNSGRYRDQWHTMARTGYTPRLQQHRSHPQLQIHPDDAARLGLTDNHLVTLHGNGEQLVCLPEICIETQPGNVFLPIHWSDQNASDGRVSKLFPAVVDPVSGQPRSKATPVELTVQPVNRWAMLYARFLPDLSALQVRYWDRTPRSDGWLVLMDCQDVEQLRCAMAQQGRTSRVLEYRSGSHIELAGSRHDELSWCVKTGSERHKLVFDRDPAAPVNWRWFMGEHSLQETSPPVCVCHEISRDVILNAISEGHRTTAALGDKLRCGTNCGSCLPEIRQLLRSRENFV